MRCNGTQADIAVAATALPSRCRRRCRAPHIKHDYHDEKRDAFAAVACNWQAIHCRVICGSYGCEDNRNAHTIAHRARDGFDLFKHPSEPYTRVDDSQDFPQLKLDANGDRDVRSIF